MNSKTRQIFTWGLLMTLVCLALGQNAAPQVQAKPLDEYNTYYVAPGGACGGQLPCYDNVQAAVNAADEADDVVKVAQGHYTPGNSNAIPYLILLDKNLTVRGGYASDDWQTSDPANRPTVFDAWDLGRVVHVTGQVSVTLQGLQITHGNAAGLGGGWDGNDAGGGVYVYQATVVISDCVLQDNTAMDGGGLYLWQSQNSQLAASSLQSNTAVMGNGGAAYVYDSSVSLADNTFYANTAAVNGGGVYAQQATLSFQRDRFESNTTNAGDGGSMYVYQSAQLAVQNCVFEQNRNIEGSGAGLCLLASPQATVNNNMFIENQAASIGGGALFTQSPSATIRRNEFSGNQATSGSGLHLQLNNDHSLIEGNYIARNQAVARAGGLYIYRSTDLDVINNLLAHNYAGSAGAGLMVESYANTPHSDVRMWHNTLVSNSGSEGINVGQSVTLYMTNTLISTHTVGVKTDHSDLQVWLDHTLWWATDTRVDAFAGGLVDEQITMIADPAFTGGTLSWGAFHLSASSAARDVGIACRVTHDIDTQIRANVGGCAPDIGADEYDSGQFCGGAMIYLPFISK